MTDLQTLSDRIEIEALRGEYTDAAMMKDYDRFAALFTHDAVVRIPAAGVVLGSRDEIRAGVERLQGLWEFFVQTVHPGVIVLDGDTASGRAYVAELGRLGDGTSHQNYAIYHDRYRRTADGWRFAERAYEVRYVDSTPLGGSAPGVQPDAALRAATLA